MEKVLNVFQRLQYALSCCDFPTFCFKPRQVLCFEKLLNGMDVIAVLPNGIWKVSVVPTSSIIFTYKENIEHGHSD